MQRISRAPVLSATRSRDSCWITDGLLSYGPRPSGPDTSDRWSSFSNLDDLGEPPVLRLRERPRLDYADDVADLRLVPLVVRVELHRAPDHLLVARVGARRFDADDDRLVHRRRDDDAAALLPLPALALRLRRPRDRLPRRRLVALRLRAYP